MRKLVNSTHDSPCTARVAYGSYGAARKTYANTLYNENHTQNTHAREIGYGAMGVDYRPFTFSRCGAGFGVRELVHAALPALRNERTEAQGKKRGDHAERSVAGGVTRVVDRCASSVCSIGFGLLSESK